ncbi:potassium transporter KtrB [Mycoplasma enhydrae]|uniref:TrkH family potassium uptake protein n=1 Tax=Mycoplasma enhydrae TaxID=2499220 RepID=UPI00197B9DCE|nr:potassium transporter TrkG [Mycoplasma enhydrae]MBN4089429.1 potassium transporter KtrB [Mycoplasma enhydrae]MCV3733485.1 potassium transporter KtrB [Mycoplasma enhydrae]MCV3753267.1 potassium transporter KtrB [Mycoplasma enhydrae]
MKNKTGQPKKNNVILRFLRKVGAVRYIFIIYVLFTILISLLLFWQASQNKLIDKPVKYIDALFISTSAFSDTGLSPLVISETFNGFGQFLIALSIVVGGIGIFTFKVYIFQSILGMKSSLFSSMVSQTERGSITVTETRKMIKIAISFLIIITVIASFIFTMLLYFTKNPNFVSASEFSPKANKMEFDPRVIMDPAKNPYKNFGQALKFGVFHAISTINNAGFDLFGNKSLQPFYKDYAFQTITIIVFLIGGIGFPVIYDIWKKIQSTKKNELSHRFQLFTKFTIITYLVTTLLGFSLSLALEYSAKSNYSFWNQSAYGNTGDKIFALYFQVSSTRSAGFSTVNYYNFSQSTILIHSVLMFIGFSPVSTAGGIRNTTVAVIFLSVITMMSQRKRINAFKRQIGKETLIKAVNVFAIAILLILVVTIASYATLPGDTKMPNNTNYPLIFVIFEACSAFGNTGLTTGLTSSVSNLHVVGKLSLIFIMIIGQFGIPQTIKIFGRAKPMPEYYQYIYEDVSIG